MSTVSNNILSKSWVYQWPKLFEDGQTNLQNDPVAGHLLLAKPEKNSNHLNELVREDSKLKSVILPISYTILSQQFIELLFNELG